MTRANQDWIADRISHLHQEVESYRAEGRTFEALMAEQWLIRLVENFDGGSRSGPVFGRG